MRTGGASREQSCSLCAVQDNRSWKSRVTQQGRSLVVKARQTTFSKGDQLQAVAQMVAKATFMGRGGKGSFEIVAIDIVYKVIHKGEAASFVYSVTEMILPFFL